MNTNKENLPQNRQQARLNKNELGQLLGQCLKLASENKISAQNTWSLPLIENLPDLIKDSDGDHTNFQRASVTLDAGVKIFSYRVDSVHTETFKMLGTMGRASGPEGEIEGDCVESEGAVNATKRRKRVVELNPDATLESNMEALNVKKFDLAFTVDPLFHKTSAQFDEGGAKGLLLNNLSVYRGCEIVFDSKDVPENAIDGASDQPRTARVDLSSLQGAVDSLSQLSGRERISPTLDEILQLLGQAPTEGAAAAAEEFVRRVAAEAGDVHPAPSSSGMQTSTFSEQHAEAGTSMPAASSLAGEQAESNVVEEGRMAEEHHGGVAPALADYDAAADYNGGGYDDDDCGFGDSGGYDHYSDDNDEQSAMHPQSSAPKSSAKQGKPGGLGEDAIQWLISAGNSSISGRGWAGGSHWRYRAAQQASTAAQGGDEEGEEVEGGRMVKKKATRQKNGPLDFVALLQQEVQPEFPKLKGKGPKRAKTPASTLLPEDHHYKPELLTRYALRPRSTIRPCWAGSAGVYGGGQAGPHQLDFGADNEFGGDFSDGDDHEGADCGGWEASEFGGAAGSTITEGGTELVSAPRRVERVDVNYSRAAKQVDVRALKETLWSGLQQVLPKEQQQEGVVLFQDVLSTVEEHNPAGRVEDLSVHLCFICMLHLANEHGLVVKGVEELNSLAISNISATAPL